MTNETTRPGPDGPPGQARPDPGDAWLDALLRDGLSAAGDAPTDPSGTAFTAGVMARVRDTMAATPDPQAALAAIEARRRQEQRARRFSGAGALAGLVLASLLLLLAWPASGPAAAPGQAALQWLQGLGGLLVGACVLAWAVLKEPQV
jgi:hypothetical protein